MQKRLLALVATVAIVLSMFAGVAFAVGERITTPSQPHLFTEVVGTDAVVSGDFAKTSGSIKVRFVAPADFDTVTVAGTKVGAINVAANDSTGFKLENKGIEHSIEVSAKGSTHSFAVHWVGKDAFGADITMDETFTVAYVNTAKQEVVVPSVVDIATDSDDKTTEEVKVPIQVLRNGDINEDFNAVFTVSASGMDIDKWQIIILKGKGTLRIPKGTKVLDGTVKLLDDDNAEVASFKLNVKVDTGDYVNKPFSVNWGSDFSYTGIGPVGTTAVKLEQGLKKVDATLTAERIFSFKDQTLAGFVPGEAKIVIYYSDSGGDKTVEVKGEIKPVALNPGRIDFTPERFVTEVTQDFKAIVDVGSLELRDHNNLQVVIRDEDGKALVIANKAFDVDEEYAVVEGKFPAIDSTTELTAEVRVQVGLASGEYSTAYSNTVDLDASRPAQKAIVTGLPKDTVNFGVENELKPVVKYREKGEYFEAHEVELILNGAGFVDERITEFPENIIPKEFGDIRATLRAYKYDVAGNKKLVYATAYTWKVIGLDVSLSQPVLAYGEKNDLTVTVTNGYGKAINNARIKFGDVVKVDPNKVNVNDGKYAISFKSTDSLVNKAGTVDVEVVAYVDGVKHTRTLKVLVLGEDKYTVTIAEQFLAGAKRSASVAVKEGSSAVTGCTFYRVDEDGNIKQVWLSSGKLSINQATAGKYTLYAVKDAKMGKASYEVVKPVLVADVEKLTDRVNSVVSFKIVDPTNDNKELDWDVSLIARYADVISAKQGGKVLVVDGTEVMVLDTADNNYKLNLLLVVSDDHLDAAELAEEVPYVGFVVYGDAAVELDDVLEIGEVEFTAEPMNPVAGVNTNVTLKLVDANGNGLEGYEIYRGSNKLGKTNEDGELAYPARFADVATFTVALDAKNSEAEVTVTPSADEGAPVLGEVPETVDQDVFELVITDDVKVAKVYINGEEQLFVPGAEVKIPLNLKLGKNSFRVLALDAADNGIDETITIVYAPAGVKLTIGKTEYVANGETKTMEAAPYLKGDHTMIPVRALETFGVKYAWDQDTKTATFELDENVVKVTVGSTTAVVNGEQAAVPVAPEIVNNRTMAPLRFVLQNLGLKVHWVPGGEITITR